MRTWFRRLAYRLRQSRHDAELREEIEAHRALRAAQMERDGSFSRARMHARSGSDHATRGGRTCATVCAPSAEARCSLPLRY